MGQLLLTFYAFECLYVAITHILINPHPGFDRMMLETYTLMGFGILGLQSVVLAGLQDGRSFVLGYNEMLTFEKNLIANSAKQVGKMKKTYSQNYHRVLDWAVIAFIFYVAIFPPTAATFCVLTDWDAYYFVSQQYLPNLMYQSLVQITLSMSIRFVLLTITILNLVN